MLLRHIEQSWDEPLAVPAVMFLNRLCVAMLGGETHVRICSSLTRGGERAERLPLT